GLAVARARRYGLGVAVFVIGLDDFTSVSERLDVPAGNELLVQLTERLRRVSRETDLASRFALDQFALLVPDVDLSGTPPRGVGGVPLNLMGFRRRIQAVLDVPYTLDGAVVRVPATTGIGVFPTTAK